MFVKFENKKKLDANACKQCSAFLFKKVKIRHLFVNYFDNLATSITTIFAFMPFVFVKKKTFFQGLLTYFNALTDNLFPDNEE